MLPVLQIEDLHIWFNVRKGTAKILNGINLDVNQGELLGLVGESGSGKSVLAMAVLGHVREPGRITKGKVIYKSQDILSISEEQLIKSVRGKEIGLMAANARAHLNPLLTVGDIIADVYMAHTGSDRTEARGKAVEILKLVGINDAERRVKSFPHELSGGMAQRVMIAITLVNAPQLIIADDCTNGLDVTVAAQVMDLFLDIMNEHESSGIFITHDLGIVAQCCTEVAIMYCGQIFEKSSVDSFFRETAHPYSALLLNALPENKQANRKGKSIGNLPNPLEIPNGCLFHPRCPVAREICRSEQPETKDVGDNHFVRCHFPIPRGQQIGFS